MYMNAVCENAKEFLTGLIGEMRFDMTVEAEWTDEGCHLDLRGEDAHIARAENGEMLDAFGPIGGYNFLWGWPTGPAAGLGAAAAVQRTGRGQGHE